MLNLYSSFMVILCLKWGPSHRMLSFLNQSCVGFPQAAAFHALIQHSSVLWGPPFRHCYSMNPQGQSSLSSSPPQAPFHELQLRGSPWAVCPSGHIHCCTADSFMSAWGDLYTVPVGCSGTTYFSMGLSWAARSFCSTPGAPSTLLLC